MEITTMATILDKIVVSTGTKVTNNKLSQSTFDKVVNEIRSDKWKSLTEQLQKISIKDDQQKFKKKNFTYFNLGIFQNNERSKFKLIRSQHLLFDYDGLSKDKLTSLKEKLKSDNSIFCFFTSPSGKGLKVIYKLDKPITDHQKFTDVYKHYAILFKIDLGAKPDKTSDAGRPCYFSYDPEIYINKDAEELLTDVTPVVEKKTTPTSKWKGAKEGERDNTLISLCGSLINSGVNKNEAIQILKGWNLQNTPPLSEDELLKTINSAYGRYRKGFVEKENCYYKVEKGLVKITSFIIKPKELLILQGKDCLVSDIHTSLNSEYKDVLIENTDWHTKQKFLKALGHTDCVFLGSDRDVQLLCEYINHKIEVKKTGTKIIGLFNDNTWVVKDLNITKAGVEKDIKIVPYDKGDEAFYNKIVYSADCDVNGFYENVLSINQPEIIIPWISWIFASPLKPILKKSGNGFPLIFVHGSQGGGKTSTSKLLMRLCGYNISDPFSCTMRIFPMLKLLSSTNAVPVFLDEFKKSDMREDQIENLLRFMRKAYMGEVESKGKADQTTEDYYISAPLCVMGEWNISQPALMERMLLVRFDGSVKKNKPMQEAFERLKNLPLEGFMQKYIEFCLNQDVDLLMNAAKEIVDKTFGNIKIAPRIKYNLSVMIFGLRLFESYAKHNNITLPVFDYSLILKKQLKEITGSENGFVRSALDQFIEELAVMVAINGVNLDNYWTRATVGNREVIAIRFNEIFPLFREHSKRRGYEGDQLDKESYKRLFKESDYVLKVGDKSMPSVRFGTDTHRALCIEIDAARKAGLNLDGFGVTECYTDVTENCNTNPGNTEVI